MTDAYVETVAWLYRLQARTGIELELARVAEAARALGCPERAAPTFHVGGTNGKGSTVQMMAAMLAAAGYRTGVFTSPHLVSFRERITIDGALVSEKEVVEGIRHLRRVVPPSVGLTAFEVMTLLAWWTFAARGVDVVVLEVGLGGRLDATNVVSPDVTIITNIAIEHEAYLGSDIETIAGEKAGIIKPDVPLVTDATGLAAAVLHERVEAVGSSCHVRGAEFDLTPAADGALVFRSPAGTISGLRLALAGEHQRANAALAVRALELAPCFAPTAESVRAGLAEVRWPGRLQLVRRSPDVLLDCAHNPAAVEVLAEALRVLVAGRLVRVLFGVMRDKAWHSMLESLGRLAAEIVLTRPRQPRSTDPYALAEVVAGPHRVEPDPERAYTTLVARCGVDDVVLVTGSIFLVGDVLPVVDATYRSVAERERQAAVLAGRA